MRDKTEEPAMIETPQQPAVPLYANLRTPHVWSKPEDGPVSCKRCGVAYPNEEACP